MTAGTRRDAGGAGPAVRTLAVLGPDWPLTAAGIEPATAAAVVVAGKVSACTPAARSAGVVPGLRRRDAQARCPGLTLVPDDPSRDARIFEPVVAAVESVIPEVEVVRAGLCLAPSRGAARYFGGDDPLASEVQATIRRRTGVDCLVGIADGPFAAAIAARRRRIIPPGGGRDFLAPLPVEVLGAADLADLLRRLGLPTLGDLARLPADDVLARFGPDGARAHRRARGLDEGSPSPRRPPRELAVSRELDPPADRVEFAVFAARSLAEQACARLADAGLACTRVLIEAQTSHGEHLGRVWRHDGPLTVTAIAERVRWQLDGWLSGTADATTRPTAGVTLLRLVPEGVVTAEGRQLGLWGEAGAAAARVARALTRVQGMLGPDAVVTAEIRGGRGPAERVRLVPWGEPRDRADSLGMPWPGSLPAPAPATVLPEPLPAVLSDAGGAPVGVSGRCTVTAAPARLSIPGRAGVEVTSWAGPWPVDARWWDGAAHQRRARFQVAAAAGPAWLLALENGRWWVEAVYD
jgi:protein ImuB